MYENKIIQPRIYYKKRIVLVCQLAKGFLNNGIKKGK